MGIATGRVVALCHGDCWACRLSTAVPWELLLGVSRECRCAMGIAGQAVLSVALCLRNCWLGHGVGVAGVSQRRGNWILVLFTHSQGVSRGRLRGSCGWKRVRSVLGGRAGGALP